MEIKKSLAPIINKKAKVLILGSMPGEESLRKQEYYGHPRNQFWRIIAEITGVPLSEKYSRRIELVQAKGIALWDVIASCRRKGSLDTNIRDENPNELLTLIDDMKDLRAVVFNGGKASQSFRKNFGFSVLEERELEYILLPSTSPANTVSYEIKLSAWSVIKKFLG